MDLERAMKNPGATFGTPEVLEVSRDLSKEQKCKILMQWKDQLQEPLQVADDENIQGPESPHGGTAELLKRVSTVLAPDERLNLPPRKGTRFEASERVPMGEFSWAACRAVACRRKLRCSNPRSCHPGCLPTPRHGVRKMLAACSDSARSPG